MVPILQNSDTQYIFSILYPVLQFHLLETEHERYKWRPVFRFHSSRTEHGAYILSALIIIRVKTNCFIPNS